MARPCDHWQGRAAPHGYATHLLPACLQLLAVNVMNPKYIDVSIEDVSGLDDIVREMVRGWAVCIAVAHGEGMGCVHSCCAWF